MGVVARLRLGLVTLVVAGLAGAPALALARPGPHGPPPAEPAGVFIDPRSGDAYVHLNHPNNTGGNLTTLDHPLLNGNHDARMLVTNQIYPYAYSAFRVDHPTGMYYNGFEWSIYTDDVTSIVAPAAWNVFIPPADSSLMAHSTTSATISGTATIIDHGLFNNDPNAILFVQHVYNLPVGPFSYFTQTISVAYDTGLGRWKIMTNDGTDMPEDIHFFVYGASADEKAYQHISTPGNNDGVDGTILNIEEANNNPDAQMLVTQNYGTGITNLTQDRRVGLEYDKILNRWVIFNQNSDTMPDGLLFNVLVIPPTTGAFVHAATAANILGSTTALDDAQLNADPYARVYVSHNWNPPESPNGIYNDSPLGVAYSTDHWVIVNRNGSPMLDGSTYNVYYTRPRSNSFSTAGSVQSVVTSTLRLNNPLLNNDSGAIAIATINYNPVTVAGPSYSATVGLRYDSGVVGFWSLFNRLGPDFPTFPTGLGVNVLIPPVSSSFIHTATVDNTLGNSTELEDPLALDNPYALVFATPRDNGEMNEQTLGVYQIEGDWLLFNENSDPIPLGTAYNVFVIRRYRLYLPELHR